jgi:uncharacterized protein with GYD domain
MLLTYIMLSTLTPEGVQTIKNNPTRIREVNREIEQLGATVKAQWAVLGQFDFVNVVEAPDEKTIARVSLELASLGTAKYETLVAIPIDDFIGAIEARRSRRPAAARSRPGSVETALRARGSRAFSYHLPRSPRCSHTCSIARVLLNRPANRDDSSCLMKTAAL